MEKDFIKEVIVGIQHDDEKAEPFYEMIKHALIEGFGSGRDYDYSITRIKTEVELIKSFNEQNTSSNHSVWKITETNSTKI